ncbi:PhzF family phenazine biosynthesis protein [Duganella sp. SG902]|uniref:PhzF family phenazine biosynthesis protein n=1 Tax=Duganella sp. SG902 TaxID=2587016 RepID=UPI00159E5B61|nr:PhzF family phenazine biosynthesis protein [Duganella sp. SG902]NVM75530.1 PhzF family phenazine biosynthesis protein [Duganella sp. SG902]
MQETSVQELLCFGMEPGGGNSALVVRHDHGSAEQRQRFARERRKPACVFIDHADGGIVLDYFYPHMRSPLCLHATLAAARVLLSPQRPELLVHTAMRKQPLTLILQDGEVFIQLSPQTVPEVTIAPELPARLLAAPSIRLASPPVIASVGSPKLLLEVVDRATLHALKPDLHAIADWGQQHAVSGCYVWCRRPDGALEGRNLNHLTAAAEDGATGVAAGALTAHLKTGITLYQGANLGMPCMLRTELRDENILIGGRTELRSTT